MPGTASGQTGKVPTDACVSVYVHMDVCGAGVYLHVGVRTCTSVRGVYAQVSVHTDKHIGACIWACSRPVFPVPGTPIFVDNRVTQSYIQRGWGGGRGEGTYLHLPPTSLPALSSASLSAVQGTDCAKGWRDCPAGAGHRPALCPTPQGDGNSLPALEACSLLTACWGLADGRACRCRVITRFKESSLGS